MKDGKMKKDGEMMKDGEMKKDGWNEEDELMNCRLWGSKSVFGSVRNFVSIL
jgi:hypothetical protein